MLQFLLKGPGSPKKQYFRSPVLHNSSAVIAQKNLGSWHTMYISFRICHNQLHFGTGLWAQCWGWSWLCIPHSSSHSHPYITVRSLTPQCREPQKSTGSGLCFMSCAVPARKLLSSRIIYGTTKVLGKIWTLEIEVQTLFFQKLHGLCIASLPTNRCNLPNVACEALEEWGTKTNDRRPKADSLVDHLYSESVPPAVGFRTCNVQEFSVAKCGEMCRNGFMAIQVGLHPLRSKWHKVSFEIQVVQLWHPSMQCLGFGHQYEWAVWISPVPLCQWKWHELERNCKNQSGGPTWNEPMWQHNASLLRGCKWMPREGLLGKPFRHAGGMPLCTFGSVVQTRIKYFVNSWISQHSTSNVIKWHAFYAVSFHFGFPTLTTQLSHVPEDKPLSTPWLHDTGTAQQMGKKQVSFT